MDSDREDSNPNNRRGSRSSDSLDPMANAPYREERYLWRVPPRRYESLFERHQRARSPNPNPPRRRSHYYIDRFVPDPPAFCQRCDDPIVDDAPFDIEGRNLHSRGHRDLPSYSEPRQGDERVTFSISLGPEDSREPSTRSHGKKKIMEDIWPRGGSPLTIERGDESFSFSRHPIKRRYYGQDRNFPEDSPPRSMRRSC